MAITGTWKSRQSIQAGALKWGTGVNPVHRYNDAHGRDIAPSPSSAQVDPTLTKPYQNDGWSDIWQDEYHEHTRDIGFFDRPNYGDNPQHVRNNTADYPEWGPYGSGIPGGTHVRSEKHGVDDEQTPNQIPTETGAEGWQNKVHGQVNNASVSDASQLLMQTSMTQRDKVREGSQRGAGSRDTHRAPIRSRIVGMKVKMYSGDRRHADMKPKTQTQAIRPFWNRSAGTGAPEMLQTNAFQQRQPMTRKVPSDPYQGQTVAVSDSANYGYQEEDIIPYA